jgi:hypothetical protein
VSTPLAPWRGHLRALGVAQHGPHLEALAALAALRYSTVPRDPSSPVTTVMSLRCAAGVLYSQTERCSPA